MSDENEAGLEDATPEQLPGSEIEGKARALGWVPEEEWKGTEPPRDGFLSAGDFLGKTIEKIPGIRRHNKELTKKLEALESKLSEVHSSAESFRVFSEKALARERQEKANYIAQLENRRAQAISEGDGNTAVAAERQIANLKAEQANDAASAQAPNPQVMAVLNQWAMANPWYQADADKQAWADGRALQLRKEGLQGIALLDRLSKDVVKAFPEDGGGNRPGGVEGRGRRSIENFGKRSFDDLPEEAKSAYEKFRKSMPKYTRAEYVRDYQWD